MKIESCIVCAVLLFPVIAWAADASAEAAAKPGVPEPNVQRTVIEDDANRIDELRVRGQTRSIVVTTKGVFGGSYEIFMGDASRDLSDGVDSRRGAAGQRMWRLISF